MLFLLLLQPVWARWWQHHMGSDLFPGFSSLRAPNFSTCQEVLDTSTSNRYIRAFRKAVPAETASVTTARSRTIYILYICMHVCNTCEAACIALMHIWELHMKLTRVRKEESVRANLFESEEYLSLFCSVAIASYSFSKPPSFKSTRTWKKSEK